MYKKHVLENGLTIIGEEIPYVKSISLGVWINAGSRIEDEEISGVSHFIEHMLFKGTRNRTSKQIASEIDNLGGQINAFTSKECTCYYVKLLDSHIDIGIDVLSDMILNSKFNEDDLDKERSVIIEELKMYEDSPEDLAYDLLTENIYKHDPLGMNIIGTEESLNRLNREKLLDYFNKYYVPNNSLITMVSSLSHDEAIKEIEKHFDNWEAKKLINLNIKDEKNKCVKKITTKENIELSTIVYLFTFYDLNKEDELALRILNHRLGESANSLLFREVRENRGLAYDIYSHLDITKNVKTLYIYTAVDEEDIEAASNAIEEIFRDIKTKKILIGDNDLNIMKKVHKTAVISTLEDSTELCSYILSQSLEGEDIFEFLKDMENLNNITADEIYEVANKVLNNPTIHILKSS